MDMASKQENIIFNLIKSLYGESIIQGFRPDFMKNSNTKKNLEIDIFLPEFKVGFEYQGAVHFREIKQYHNNADNSRVNDLKKYSLLSSKRQKVSIVEVFEEDLKGDIPNNLCKRIYNTQLYYFNNKQFKKLIYLELSYLLLKLKIKRKDFINLPPSKKDKKSPKLNIDFFQQLAHLGQCSRRLKDQAFDNLSKYDMSGGVDTDRDIFNLNRIHLLTQ